MGHILNITCIAFSVAISASAFSLILAEDDLYCTPKAAAKCFEKYLHPLLTQIYSPSQEEVLRRQVQPEQCSYVEKKLPCHEKFALCPKTVIANFSRQETGYEQLRRIVCDPKMYMDFLIGRTCIEVNSKKAMDCQMKIILSRGSPSAMHNADQCSILEVHKACSEELFSLPCPISKEAAVNAHKRGYAAAALLSGCDDTNGSGPVAVSTGTLIALLAMCLFPWMRA